MRVRAWFRFRMLTWFALVSGPILSWWSSPARAAEAPSRARQSEEGKPLAVGTSSCSARACHGSLLPAKNDAIHRDEYTKWLANDKHAQAYRVLFGERSRTIAKNLGLSAAPTAERCLVCHQYPNREYLRGENFFGVGCEACHGTPRSGWSHIPENSVRTKSQRTA
jgi:hypothetical protein